MGKVKMHEYYDNQINLELRDYVLYTCKCRYKFSPLLNKSYDLVDQLDIRLYTCTCTQYMYKM